MGNVHIEMANEFRTHLEAQADVQALVELVAVSLSRKLNCLPWLLPQTCGDGKTSL